MASRTKYPSLYAGLKQLTDEMLQRLATRLQNKDEKLMFDGNILDAEGRY